MSNIAGKAYAMNLLTPLTGVTTLINKVIFWAVRTPLFKSKLRGLITLSMIHYAGWVIMRGRDFPRISREQPEEDLEYSYMLFFSNFNGSWAQYVDSFSAAIPSGLDLLWRANVGWPTSVPEQPFHRYVGHNQFYTNHYYNAYPMAASNDVKAARRLKDALRELARRCETLSPEQFAAEYTQLLKQQQDTIGELGPTPIVSLATEAVLDRRNMDAQIQESGKFRAA